MSILSDVLDREGDIVGGIVSKVASKMSAPPTIDFTKFDSSKLSDSRKAELKESILNGQAEMKSTMKKVEEQIEKEAKKKFGNLKTNVVLLFNNSSAFVSRIALIAPAIISTTPVGPGVSANMIPAMVEQLKSDGENLGKAYDDTENALDDLKTMCDGVGGVEAIDTLNNAVSILLGVVAPLLAMVGISRGGQEASEPSVEPPINIENKPTDCDNYEGEYKSYNTQLRTAENCTAYEELLEGKGRSCNNCKKFKK